MKLQANYHGAWKNITIREGSTFRWMLAECLECGATCGEVRVQTRGKGVPDDWRKHGEMAVIAEWNKRYNVEFSGATQLHRGASAGTPGYTAGEIVGHRTRSGESGRVDRLKAIGNGQVPQAAAAAWRCLAHV